LIAFTKTLSITTSNSIKLQSSSLVQLTKSISMKISQEDAETCASNLLSAVNGPLQQRTTILDLDSQRAK